MLSITKVDKLAIRLSDKLQLTEIDTLAKQTGFAKRKAKKITPTNFLLAFFLMMLTGGRSLSCFAETIGLLTGCLISKQAVFYRITDVLIKFLECILAKVLLQNTQTGIKKSSASVLAQFTRILIHDSTSIRLNKSLASYFPGSKNATNSKFASLKIQAVFELVSEQFIHFFFSPFTVNDQKVTSDIVSMLKPGDLLIRDLGYFVLSALKKIQEQQAYFLSRLKYGIALYELDGVTRFNLLKQLRKYGFVDIDILLSAKEKLPVRLVAIPVLDEIAAERRRKYRQNRDRRLNPSKEHLSLLGWDVFVTNIPKEKLSIDQIKEIYGLRWRIEIVFKSWKSNFNIQDVPNANLIRVLSYIYAMLIFITIFQVHIFVTLYGKGIKDSENQLSLLKVTRFFKDQVWAIMLMVNELDAIEKQILYHCRYENRSNRTNYFQKIDPLT